MILCLMAPMKRNFVLYNFVVSLLEVVTLIGTCYRENWERKMIFNESHIDEKNFYNNFLIVCWCFLTLSLATLIIYAVKNESHYLCNTWFMCECLMLAFVLFITVYIYAGVGENLTVQNDNISFLRHPRMKLIIAIHIFLKVYGLWVISDFMNSINARFRRISSLIQSVHPNLPPIIISNLTDSEKVSATTRENANEVEQKSDTEKEPKEVEEREFKESFKYQRL